METSSPVESFFVELRVTTLYLLINKGFLELLAISMIDFTVFGLQKLNKSFLKEHSDTLNPCTVLPVSAVAGVKTNTQ